MSQVLNEVPLERAPGRKPTKIAPQESKAVALAGRIIRTVVTVGLFLFVAKATKMREKILHDVRINRKFLSAFYIFISIFIGAFLFLFFTLRVLRPANRRIRVEDWDKAYPKTLYASAGSFALSVICFVFALWDCFQLMTIAIGFLGLLSCVFVLQWIPF